MKRARGRTTSRQRRTMSQARFGFYYWLMLGLVALVVAGISTAVRLRSSARRSAARSAARDALTSPQPVEYQNILKDFDGETGDDVRAAAHRL